MSDDGDSAVGRRQRRRSVLENARDAVLDVATIIDVGFATGTEGLYGVFDAYNFLVEPIAEMEPALRDFVQSHPKTSYVLAAASDSDGVAEIVVRRSAGASGFHATTKAGDSEQREVAKFKLDTLVRDHGLVGPFLIKIDVEGHELHVLKGAIATLAETALIILEIHPWNDDRKRGSATMMDLFRFMEDAGFAFYDLIEPFYRPLDGALFGFDGVWVKADGPLRRVRSFRSKEDGDLVRSQRIEKNRALFDRKSPERPKTAAS
ncbi:MAG: FkbM family methyltransferase [Caulobacterales bacterium]|nr:FkbM family methyltransferase [Caulobacterales bacterium]